MSDVARHSAPSVGDLLSASIGLGAVGITYARYRGQILDVTPWATTVATLT